MIGSLGMLCLLGVMCSLTLSMCHLPLSVTEDKRLQQTQTRKSNLSTVTFKTGHGAYDTPQRRRLY